MFCYDLILFLIFSDISYNASYFENPLMGIKSFYRFLGKVVQSY